MKNIKLNIKKFLKMKGIIIVLTASTITTSLAGCSKKAECQIGTSHAHKYINEQGYIRYIDKEYLTYEKYTRQEDYIPIEEQEKLYEFLDKNNLMKISDNLEKVLEVQEQYEDYMEYEYSYIYRQPIPHYIRTGKFTTVTYTYRNVKKYDWTSDPTHDNLTGKTRVCHCEFQGCKITQNENGKYQIEYSDYVEDLTTIMDEYPFIKQTYGRIFYYEDETLETFKVKQNTIPVSDTSYKLEKNII